MTPRRALQATWIVARCAALGLACSAAGAQAPEPKRVAVVFGGSRPYRVAAEALAARVRSAGYQYKLIELPARDGPARQRAIERLAAFEPTVVAAGGVHATARALKAVPQVPVVFFMVPNALDAPFLAGGAPGGRRVAGVTSDVAPDQQFAWIAEARPRVKRIAVLRSARSRRTTEALREAGRKRGIEVVPIPAARDEFATAIEALNRSGCDGVLMIPDAGVYNSPNVQRLLLWGIRNRRPVWTFSDRLVKAGAFAGFYCDSRAVGNEAAELVREIIGGKRAAAIGLRHPERFGRAVNVRTAELIGVSLDRNMLDSGVVRFGEPR